MSALVALWAVVTSTAPLLAPLVAGDPIPTWRQPVANAEKFGAPQIDLRDFYRGGPSSQQRVLVTFGASWCAPCKKELAALNAARDRLGSAKVIVVVADETPEGRASMVKWLTEELAVPFAVVVDELGILRRRYRAEALPAAFVADAQGRLVWAKAGYDEGSVEGIIALLTR